MPAIEDLAKQHLFQDVIENAPSIVFIKDTNGKYLFINKEFEKQFNLTKEQVIGKTDYDISTKEIADAFAANEKLVFETLKPITLEQEFLNEKNSEVFLSSKFPLLNEKGNAYAIGGIYRNITGIKRETKNLRMLIESSPYTIILVNKDGKINLANSHTEKIFGYSPAELIDQSLEILIPERFRSHHVEQRAEFNADPTERPMGKGRDLYGLRKDGKEVRIEIGLSPITIEGELFTMAVITDITVRKQMEESLRASERRFSYVLAATQDSIYDWDLETGRIWRNEQYEKVFDGPSGPKFEWWSTHIHPDEINDVIARQEAAFKKRDQLWNQEYRFRRIDGDYAYVIDRGFIIYNGDGKPIRVIGALMDITERKKFIDDLARSLALMRATFDSTTNGLLVENADGKIVDYNKKFVELWRIPNEVLETKDHDQIIAFLLSKLKEPAKFLDKVKEMSLKPDSESFDVLGFIDGRTFERYSKPQRINMNTIGRVWSFRDVSQIKKGEDERKKRTLKIIERQGELILLNNSIINLQLKEKLNKIIVSDARTVEVERVSLWWLNEDRTAITSENIYVSIKNGFISGTTLYRKDYPRYFNELFTNRVIDANDAINDPRTSEFGESYLKPNGITSMMDVPIRFDGKVIGIICHEHIGPARVWTYEEQVFATSISDIITMVLENEEKRKVTVTLLESEKRLQLATTQLPVIFWTVDKNLNFVSMLGQGINKIGLKQNEVVGKTIYDFFETKDIANPLIAIHRDALKGKSGTVEYEFKNVFFQIFIEPIIDANNEITGISGLAFDITDRKKNEDQLRLNEEKWKFAIEGSRDGIWEMDLSTNKITLSKRCREMLGYSENEFDPNLDEWRKRVHPDDLPMLLQDRQKVIESSMKYYTNEHRMLAKDGTWKWILIRGMVLSRDANGKALKMTGTYTDISDIKKAEEVIKKSEQRFRMFAEISSEAVVIHSKGKIMETNPVFTKLFGYTEQEAIGMNFLMLIAPTSKDLLQKDINNPQKNFLLYSAIRKDGYIFPAEDKRIDMIYKNQDVIVSSIHDITEREKIGGEEKKRTEKLMEQQKELLRLNSLK